MALYILSIILFAAAVSSTWCWRDDLRRLRALERTSTERDSWLDYVLRAHALHLTNPYITRPTFEEKRCAHCNYPLGAEHDPGCLWLLCRPLTSKLYK